MRSSLLPPAYAVAVAGDALSGTASESMRAWGERVAAELNDRASDAGIDLATWAAESCAEWLDCVPVRGERAFGLYRARDGLCDHLDAGLSPANVARERTYWTLRTLELTDGAGVSVSDGTSARLRLLRQFEVHGALDFAHRARLAFAAASSAGVEFARSRITRDEFESVLRECERAGEPSELVDALDIEAGNARRDAAHVSVHWRCASGGQSVAAATLLSAQQWRLVLERSDALAEIETLSRAAASDRHREFTSALELPPVGIRLGAPWVPIGRSNVAYAIAAARSAVGVTIRVAAVNASAGVGPGDEASESQAVLPYVGPCRIVRGFDHNCTQIVPDSMSDVLESVLDDAGTFHVPE